MFFFCLLCYCVFLFYSVDCFCYRGLNLKRLLTLFPRIQLTRQLEVEADESVPGDFEQNPHKVQSKQKLEKKDEANCQSSELAINLEPHLPPTGELLMVEVENIAHEHFQVTEEVKVSLKGKVEVSYSQNSFVAFSSDMFT